MTKQLLLVPLPLVKVQLVGIPDGVLLKVTVPPGDELYKASPFVTVAVQDSETPMLPGDGEHDRVVDVEV